MELVPAKECNVFRKGSHVITHHRDGDASSELLRDVSRRFVLEANFRRKVDALRKLAVAERKDVNSLLLRGAKDESQVHVVAAESGEFASAPSLQCVPNSNAVAVRGAGGKMNLLRDREHCRGERLVERAGPPHVREILRKECRYYVDAALGNGPVKEPDSFTWPCRPLTHPLQEVYTARR